MAFALLNNKPLVNIDLPKKNEMVEVIDSDEENDSTEKMQTDDYDDRNIEWDEAMESQVEQILQGICSKVDLKKQLQWENTKIRTDLRDLRENQSLIANELKILEEKSSKMYSELYSFNKPRLQRQPSIEIIHKLDQKTNSPPSALRSLLVTPNPPAQLEEKSAPPQVIDAANDKIFHAVKDNVGSRMQNWAPCRKLQEVCNVDGTKKYRVQFFDMTTSLVDGKCFALNNTNINLQIGARVICQFPRTNPKTKVVSKRYLPGVVGEKLSKYNNYRYLVFCDYGPVQYSKSHEIREISEASADVWNDVHENLKLFIRDYLQSQTQCQRALLNLRPNQQVLTERNGHWIKAVVHTIDCSVVKIYFPEDNASEWIYRGSKTLFDTLPARPKNEHECKT